jgi:hypothetical protein
LVCLGVLAGNTYSLVTGPRPFTHASVDFRVAHYIGDAGWVENAPLILSNYFKEVHLLNVKNDLTVPKNAAGVTVQSFGVQSEIVRIFNNATADYSNYPLDYRNVYFAAPNDKVKVLTRIDLLKYRHFTPSGEGYMQVHCAPLVGKNCTLGFYWDANLTKRKDRVTFVAVRIQKDAFGLIEQKLFNKLIKAAPHA